MVSSFTDKFNPSAGKSKGYVLLLISVFAFVAANLLAKKLYAFLPVAQAQFLIRAISMATTFSNGIPQGVFRISEYKKALAPALCITVGSVFWNYGIDYADPGDCMTIVSMLPLYTALIGYLLFHKDFPKQGFYQSAISCFTGCVLLVQPAFLFGSTRTSGRDLIGYSLVLIDLCFYSSYILFTEILDIDPVFLVFVTSAMRMLVFGAMVLAEFTWKSTNAYCFILIIICASSLTIGGITRTAATRITGSVPAAFFVLLETPFTYFFQSVFFSFPINMLQLVGVAIILTGVVFFIHISNVADAKIEDFEDEL